MEIENRLAEFVTAARYEDIPRETIAMAKAIVLNIVGTTVAGAAAEGAAELVALAKGWGGAAEATILAHGGKVPAHEAVLVNSYMARAYDFECMNGTGIHLPAAYVPVALAASEMVGGISGRDFLVALIAGSDVGYRIGAATRPSGWDRTGLASVYAGAAVAGRIFGLDEKRMRDALGIAFNRQAGSFQAELDGSLCVQLIQAFAAQSALLSAILARRGFNGPGNFVEGIYGHFKLFSVDGKYDPDLLIGGLGERYEEIGKTIFKPWPICGVTTMPAEITMRLIREHGIAYEDVVRVVLGLWGHHYKMSGRPFQMGDVPRVSAVFNVRYVVASVLKHGEPKLAHFDEAAIRALAGTGLIEKITVERLEGAPRAEVAIETKSGRIYRASRSFSSGMPGDAANPLSEDQRMAVFWHCVQHGARYLPSGSATRVAQLVARLEELPDVREIIGLLARRDEDAG